MASNINHNDTPQRLTIAPYLWTILFDESLSSEEEAWLLSEPLNNGDFLASGFIPWLARDHTLAYGFLKHYPACTFQTIRDELLPCSYESILLAAAAVGHAEIFSHAFARLEEERLMTLERNIPCLSNSPSFDLLNKTFVLALLGGHQAILDFFYHELFKDHPEYPQPLEESGLIAASRFAMTEAIEWQLKHAQSKLSTLIYQNDDYNTPLIALIKGGSWNNAHYLLQSAPDIADKALRHQQFAIPKHLALNNQTQALVDCFNLAPETMTKWFAKKGEWLYGRVAPSKKPFDVVALLNALPEHRDNLLKATYFRIAFWPAMTGDTQLFDLVFRTYPNEARQFTFTTHFYAFALAAEKGHLSIMKRFVNTFPHRIQEMVMAHDYGAFRCACKYGRSEALQYVINLAPDKIDAMLEARRYESAALLLKKQRSFSFEFIKNIFDHYPKEKMRQLGTNISPHMLMVCDAWDKETLDYVYKLIPEATLKLLFHPRSFHFESNIIDGNLAFLTWAMATLPEQTLDALIKNNFHAFAVAVTTGQFEIAHYLLSLFSGQEEAVITSNGTYRAFIMASRRGRVKGMKLLISMAPKHTEAMVCANTFKAFREAVISNKVESVKFLFELMPHLQQAMALSNDREAIKQASLRENLDLFYLLCKTGKLSQVETQDILEQHWQTVDFWQLNSRQEKLLFSEPHLKRCIEAHKPTPFIEAANQGKLQILRLICHLANNYPQHKKNYIEDAISHDNFKAFRKASFRNHLNVAKELLSLCPQKAHAMIAAEDYEAFRDSLQFDNFYQPHIKVADHLIELVPDNVEAILTSKDCALFKYAARKGKVELVEKILSLAGEQGTTMLQQNLPTMLNLAYENRRFIFLNWLLSKSGVLEQADSLSDTIRQDIVTPYVRHQLNTWVERQKAFELENPHEPFDIPKAEIRHVSFMINRTIRDKDEALLYAVRKLMDTPSFTH